MESKSESRVLRNGPPDAVRTRRANFVGLPATKALMYGVVFTVDGKEFTADFLGGGHDQLAGGDENFFVGQRHNFAQFYGFVGGFQAHHTDGSGDDDFRASQRGHGDHALAAVMDGWEGGEGFGA